MIVRPNPFRIVSTGKNHVLYAQHAKRLVELARGSDKAELEYAMASLTAQLKALAK